MPLPVSNSLTAILFLGTPPGFLLSALLSTARLPSFIPPIACTWHRTFLSLAHTSFSRRGLSPFQPPAYLWYRPLFEGTSLIWSTKTLFIWNKVRPVLKFGFKCLKTWLALFFLIFVGILYKAESKQLLCCPVYVIAGYLGIWLSFEAACWAFLHTSIWGYCRVL